MAVKVLALDLEQTLVDDALSGHPRPGLREFLSFCHERFGRVAIFSTVEEADAREVFADLADSGRAPAELVDRLEYVAWCGEYKDLAFVAGAWPGEVILVDDDAGWIRPDQRDRWVPVSPWDGGPDRELGRVRSVLEGWLGGDGGPGIRNGATPG